MLFLSFVSLWCTLLPSVCDMATPGTANDETLNDATPLQTMTTASPFSAEQLAWLQVTFGGSTSTNSAATTADNASPRPQRGSSTGEGSGSRFTHTVPVIRVEPGGRAPVRIATSIIHPAVTGRRRAGLSPPIVSTAGQMPGPAPTRQVMARFRLALLPGTGVDQVQAPQQGKQSQATMGLPLFSPEQVAANGLGLLAALALSPLSKPGPYNPAASLAPKVLKRILDLDFVEMSEVTVDDVSPQVPGCPPPPARLPITDISQWIERYSLMAAVLCSKFPDKAGELFAYQASIVRAERNYEGKRWVAYDYQYRREALARKDLNWSITDPRLYNEAFTGRAWSIARCSYCLQDDHSAAQCPRNPNRPIFGWFPDPSLWPAQPVHASPPTPSCSSTSEICRRYNEGRCRFARCRYHHQCSGCGGDHAWVSCPRSQTRQVP